MKIYNTYSRQLEDFQPIEPGKVKMYVCGPTVYNYIHVGNARSVVAFDLVRKYLEFRGFEVEYISNFTDVDDKIIKAAASENISTKELSERYIAAFYEDTDLLNVKRASQNPKATEFIEAMIDFIQELLDKDYAYISEGDVYFRVAKSKDYAKLANKNLADLLAGASGRTDEETNLKESPADFALWKSVKADEVSWQAPWGAGRPGWHIECSVMSTSLLGETIDIHGGGADLEFPHHTNEIAQSEAKTGQKFVNYWMHNGFVNVDGEKMSKSLGNFTTVHELLQVVDPQILRFFLTTTHYRRPLNFTDDALTEAENNIKKIENAYRHLDDQAESNLSALTTFRNDFVAAMDEDFNIANGMTVFYDFVSWVNKGNGGAEVKAFFDQVLEILGIKFEIEQSLDSEIEAMIEARQLAREVRDFAKSDEIRDALKAQGIVLEDTKDGVRWHRE
ncbi:cysteine--tRNA ligase, cysS [Lactococcus cremoris]|jgi:cysteinyl-tRNA synthetase|uniref:Cysteine--tRNA ligase n=1 Tax=Lactococcus cremoris subsp. cremoris IBB477 TaxID=1449093 RepID=A0A1E7G5Q1_LACLC|nr:cysteine--tRNA ligase [Lactococcus cremoris]MCI1841015.1 cysteine--tRNA ligase [Lactococcus lactis]KKW71418.1 cysteine--tRNA ligase, cysS [Lactococcus cremoris]MCT0456987.1 cysteine--tRNA ligase [Lactococcus cremoris]MCT0475808.1 cysteine--tRNA ligase [Lactococcus cremoris]MCT0478162.1 cysteine--tRNA ligase [Lactococcus cremoris]